MADCQLGLAGKIPEGAAVIPAFGKVWIERERPVRQHNHGINVFAKKSEHEGGFAKDIGVVVCNVDGLAGKT